MIDEADMEPAPHRRLDLWADMNLLGAALIWGINIPIMKIGLDRVDIFVFNALRS